MKKKHKQRIAMLNRLVTQNMKCIAGLQERLDATFHRLLRLEETVDRNDKLIQLKWVASRKERE